MRKSGTPARAFMAGFSSTAASRIEMEPPLGHLIIFAIGFLAGHLFARLPAKPLTVREQPRELVPIIPAVVRKRRADQWVN